MTDEDRIVWAAMFARTNMGQEMPTADDIRRYRVAARHGTSLEAMVNMVCASYIENQRDFDMFVEEARDWHLVFQTQPDDYISSNWPKKQAVWEASDVSA